VLVLLSDLNEWPLLFANYDTSTPVANFYGRVLAGYVQSLLISGLGGFVAVFLFDVFLQMAAGLRELPRPSLAKPRPLPVCCGARRGSWHSRGT